MVYPYPALTAFHCLGVRGIRSFFRLIQQGEHPARRRESCLQLGNHPGNLIEWLGILIRVGQKGGDAAYAQIAVDNGNRSYYPGGGVHDAIDEPGAGIGNGRG